MSDEMMSYIVSGGEPEDSWSEQIAMDLAAKDQLSLTPEHFEVIHFLRSLCRDGKPVSPRDLLQALEQQFADKGGRKYLYQLFPNGPVTQACCYGGMQIPANNRDLSFGTSW